MKSFAHARTNDVAGAVREVAADSGAKLIAGGTNLNDLMKENVERPSRLIDITGLPLAGIHPGTDGGLRLGALVTSTNVAYNDEVERCYPLLSQAILTGASPRLRNMATVGGNLMQRARCCYFYDTATPCNKREPGTGCSAIAGFNRAHAILGTSAHCIATHPSEMCVALSAPDAVVTATGPGSERAIPLIDFHRLPGDTPHVDTSPRAEEIITGVDPPEEGFAEHHSYLKVRDRSSYAFGRFMTRNLADYHVPVNADVHDNEVIFVEERDEVVPLGAKGSGEMGIVGAAPAIANAVFHATGKRIRDLPITLDKLL